MVSMKNDISMRPLDDSDQTWLPGFIAQHWGASYVLAHDERIDPTGLPGFVVEQNGDIAGLVTYRIQYSACEVVTIDSLQPNQGIGGALLDAVMEAARTAGCKRLWLVTSNDNLNALRFYQKRGLRLVRTAPWCDRAISSVEKYPAARRIRYADPRRAGAGDGAMNTKSAPKPQPTGDAAALLVIDVQQGLFEKPIPIYQAEKLLANLNRLIDSAAPDRHASHLHPTLQ